MAKGEFFNQSTLARIADTDAGFLSDPALLVQLYCNDEQLKFLRQIDGIYSAVLYDANRKIVHLDRKQVTNDWKTHLEGKNRTRKICQYLTFEIWLRHVFTATRRIGRVEEVLS